MRTMHDFSILTVVRTAGQTTQTTISWWLNQVLETYKLASCGIEFWKTRSGRVNHSTLNMKSVANGGFLTMGFLPKMIILGCEMGVPPFKETPKSVSKTDYLPSLSSWAPKVNSSLRRGSHRKTCRLSNSLAPNRKGTKPPEKNNACPQEKGPFQKGNESSSNHH